MSPLTLESFEDALTDESGPTTAFNDGYQQGFDAGRAAAEMDSATLGSALVQAISDIDFTYTEARAQLLKSLGPLFETLTEAVLPHCIETGFAGQLAEELARAAAADTNSPIRIHIHPDQLVAVQMATEQHLEVEIHADPALGPHAARIEHGNTETQLELDRLLGRINEALGAIATPENRKTNYG